MLTLHRVPTLPTGKDLRDWVNSILDRAEVVEMPPEASPAGMLRDEILRIVAGLPAGDNEEDLDAQKAVVKDGQRCLKLRTIAAKLDEGRFQGMAVNAIATHLHEMGFEHRSIRLGNKGGIRIWGCPPEPEPEVQDEAKADEDAVDGEDAE